MTDTLASMVRMTVSMPTDLVAWGRRMAYRDGISMSQFIRQLVIRYLADHPDVGRPGRFDTCPSGSTAILGEHGLFIPDVTKHEPEAVAIYVPDNLPGVRLDCICGWTSAVEGESYFDHLAP